MNSQAFTETMTDILTGGPGTSARAQAHEMVDDLFDAAAEDGGKLFAPAVIALFAEMAELSGLAEDLEYSAFRMVVEKGVPEDPYERERLTQFAILYQLLDWFSAYGIGILPQRFLPEEFMAVMKNFAGKEGAIYPDRLGLGSMKGGMAARRRIVRRVLVEAVYFRAAKADTTLAKARRQLLPALPNSALQRGQSFDRTWQDWQREVAKYKGVGVKHIGDDARNAARTGGDTSRFELSPATIEALWQIAWVPR